MFGQRHFHFLAVALFLAGFWYLGQQEGRSQFIGEGVWKAVASGYQGPGDIVSGASVYWSCTLAYNAAYANSHGNACDMFRTSDSATCTSTFATNGVVDISVATPCAGATVTAFCNATTCRYTQAYDQTGNGNPGIPAANFYPFLTFNGVGTCPTTTYTNAGQEDFRDLALTSAPPWTSVAIVRSTSALGPGDLGGSGTMQINQAANNLWLSAFPSAITFGISQNTIYAVQGTQPASGTASLVVNGTTTTGATGKVSTNATQISRSFDGDALLAGVWPISFNGTQLANMNTLLRSKCGGF